MAKTVVERMKLGTQGLEVSAQGLGCLSMSTFYLYGPPPKPESDMTSLIHHAINFGITFFDTSDIYGPFTNETFIGKALSLDGGVRDKVQIATKFSIIFANGKNIGVFDNPRYIREACEASVKRLGVDCSDLYYKHRIDNRVPIQIMLKKLVQEGKLKNIGLSEASAATIRIAHAIHPITAVQLEWSLWSRDAEEDIIPTCRELGIGIVAYSPLGRGFLSKGSKLLDEMPKEDYRKYLPRFQPENVEQNKTIFERLSEMAASKGCTPPQLALAWVHHQGNDVCPLPGATKIEHFDLNIAALSVKLTPEEMAELESFASADAVKGDRFGSNSYSWKESDTPPLSSWKAT